MGVPSARSVVPEVTFQRKKVVEWYRGFVLCVRCGARRSVPRPDLLSASRSITPSIKIGGAVSLD